MGFKKGIVLLLILFIIEFTYAEIPMCSFSQDCKEGSVVFRSRVNAGDCFSQNEEGLTTAVHPSCCINSGSAIWGSGVEGEDNLCGMCGVECSGSAPNQNGDPNPGVPDPVVPDTEGEPNEDNGEAGSGMDSNDDVSGNGDSEAGSGMDSADGDDKEDGDVTTSDNDMERTCGNIECGQIVECPKDSCDTKAPFEDFLDYPDSAPSSCVENECIAPSCEPKSKEYSKECDKDDDNDGDPDDTDPSPDDPKIYSDAEEACDNIDNNGNGETDEGLETACAKQEGVCQGTLSRCINGRWSVCSYGTDYVSNENGNYCDGLDNDCDGSTDESCECEEGDTKPCGISTGECSQGIQECENGEYGSCRNSIGPKAEICNGMDDDCDGLVDENSLNRQEFSIRVDCNINSCSGFLICSSNGLSDCILRNDEDSDQICDEIDNCANSANSNQKDTDGDDIGDACDACITDPKNDIDRDGVCGNLDNCLDKPNRDQKDTDRDGLGDACDICINDSQNDIDQDDACGNTDNCKNRNNPGQEDCDEDGLGDACDADSVCSTDSDNDEINDFIDNCPAALNHDQKDTDGDSLGDMCDSFPNDPFNDKDKDTVEGTIDNCPDLYNSAQLDTDQDGLGDACDLCPNDFFNDIDADNICGNLDNCPGNFNPFQGDCDIDGVGDACDFASDCSLDNDKDDIKDSIDNCADIYNPSQADADKDKIGDECDFCKNDPFNDADKDGICADTDNCPQNSNYNQKDTDFDGFGDLCDTCLNDKLNDLDKDGVCADTDNCPLSSNPSQTDCDLDNLGDICDRDSSCSKEYDSDSLTEMDNCADKSNTGQFDSDGDGIGDECDKCIFDPMNDLDNDGVCGNLDNCPIHKNENQFDSDKDNVGNTCDRCMNDPANDKDGDLLCGNFDNCPEKFNPSQQDCDQNNIGDACDISDCIMDYDNDGIKDNLDNCPENANFGQEDEDKDGLGDLCDLCPLNDNVDIDQDSICGKLDNCQNIFNFDQQDSDEDNIGDACDLCPNDSNNDIDEDSLCADVDNCPYDYNPTQEECEKVTKTQVPFDKVLKLEQEKLDVLFDKANLNSNLSEKQILENSESLKKSVKIESKEYVLNDIKYTRYKITLNPKKKADELTYYQNIPKCIAQKSENIFFNGKNYNVIDKDPLIAWHFSEIKDKVEMTYDVKGEVAQECLDELKDFIYSDELIKSDKVDIIKGLIPLFLISIVIGLTLFFKTHQFSDQ